MASVGAIIDRQGGIRIVVTERELFVCHVLDGELLYLLPDFEIDATAVQAGPIVESIEAYLATNPAHDIRGIS